MSTYPRPDDVGLVEHSYDAALHLLDHQILDVDGEMVANVDDLELVETEDGRLVVSAILTGPGALGRRMPGRPGQWIVAIWQRLRADEEPAEGRIEWSDVSKIGSAISIKRKVDDLGLDGLEQWLRTYVVGRIPGAGHRPDKEDQ